MPVAVERIPAMGASKGKSIAEPHLQPLPPVDTPQKTSRRQKHHREAGDSVQNQPVAGSSTTVNDSDWTWRSLTESSASRVPPILTKDGSYFLSATGPSIKIYSVSTCHVVSTLSIAGTASRPSNPTGYGEAITSMSLNPHNPFQLFTGSLDGCVRVWDFVDAILLQTIDVCYPILYLAAHANFKNEVCVAVSKKTRKLNHNRNPTAEENASVLRVSLTPTEATSKLPVQRTSDLLVVGRTRAPFGLAFSPSGSWLVVIGGHKSYVARTSNFKAGFTKFVSPDKLSCLAFHPTEEYFATGDSKGVVRLWYCLNDNIPSGVIGVEKKAPTTTLHWHAHAVSSIAFTANGAYLLSGGEEAVLVLWQLHSGKKEFVPRVGAAITNITVSNAQGRNEEYLVGLADASFIFVRSGTLKISKTIARVKLDPAISHDRPTSSVIPLAAHSITSSLILPSSHPSTLQTYSVLNSTLLSELEVSPSNRVSRREDKAAEPSRVTIARISENGQWMATVDSRESRDEFRGEVYLKIWWWDKKASSWILNTRVDRPHGLKKVTAVSFRPRAKDSSLLRLATTGEDGNIKIWGIQSTTSKSGEGEAFWVTRSTIRFRSEIPSHVSWSLDGSLLAVTLGPHVVLYDPTTSIVLKTLTCPECPAPISTHFIGRSGRYLAVQGLQDIVLWDIITDNVRWHYQSATKINHVSSHHREDSFVVFESDSQTFRTRVSKFSPSSAVSLSTHCLPFQLLSIAACPPRWLQSSDPSSFAFVGVTNTWNTVVFGDQIHLVEKDEAQARGIGGAAPVTKQTLFQDLFGKSALNDITAWAPLPASVHNQGSSWKGKEIEKIFDTAAYLLPPLGTLFDPLMDTFLTLRTSNEREGKEDENLEQADEDMDMDAEGSEVPIVVGNRLERIVDQHEMLAMIELFQVHGLQSPSLISPSTIPPTNGYSKTPGKPNGASSHTATMAKANGATPRPQKAKVSADGPLTPSQPTNSPAVKAGQKRKKSLG